MKNHKRFLSVLLSVLMLVTNLVTPASVLAEETTATDLHDHSAEIELVAEQAEPEVVVVEAEPEQTEPEQAEPEQAEPEQEELNVQASASDDCWHWAKCPDSTTCVECGYVGEGIYYIEHSYSQFDAIYDDTHHWWICEECGAIADKCVHEAIDCADQVCYLCGATNVTFDGLRHNWSNEYQSDETGHWRVCLNCGEVEGTYDHWASCDNRTICVECGYVGEGIYICHNFNEENGWQYDADMHWLICERCGERVEKGSHAGYCSNGYCNWCHASDVNFTNIWHSYEYTYDNYQSDETGHWLVCPDCGETGDTYDHWASCDNRAICAECGYVGSDLPWGHDDVDWDTLYSDSDYDWYLCNTCGAVINKTFHRESCTAPGTCANCGKTGSEVNLGDELQHNWYSEDKAYNETEHWAVCRNCGEKVEQGMHIANCSEKTCYWCDAADVTFVEVWHYWPDDNYQSDETGHWRVCADCGEAGDTYSHWASCDDRNTCRSCGYVGSNLNWSHYSVDWDTLYSDNDYDWYICKDCGAVINKTFHSASCTAPGICASCGKTGSEVNLLADELQHNWYSEDIAYNETEHWAVCRDCGEKVGQGVHIANCSEKTCYWCNAADVTFDHLWHNWSDDNYQSNETGHWRVCADCGETGDTYSHWASCDDRNTCESCGYVGSNLNWSHYSVDWDTLYSDNDYDWYICKDCDEVINKTFHRASCTAPGICASCGKTGSEVNLLADELQHNWSYEDKAYNETEHWAVCTDCGAVINPGPHRRNCSENTCYWCGASDVTFDYIWHRAGDDYQYDETSHWSVCTDCGETIYSDTHSAGCSNPDVCIGCGATGVVIDEVFHNYDWENAKHDNNYHWYECMDCGKTSSKNTHWATCTDPDVCRNCGAEGVKINYVDHDIDWDHAEYDEKSHWYLCSNCGKTTAEIDWGYFNHVTSCANPTNECLECGATNVKTQVSHVYEDNFGHDKNYHWQICGECGEAFDMAMHYTHCTNGVTCSECDAANVNFNWINHEYEWDNIDYDKDYHWFTCSECGEVEKEPHYQNCDNLGVCDSCGAADVDFEFVNHRYNWNDYEYDTSSHWHACLKCGEKDVGFHAEICSNPGVCNECGATDVRFNWISHRYDFEDVKSDESSHWWICTLCNEKVDESNHFDSCAKPGVCMQCGATDILLGWHNHNYPQDTKDYSYNESYHWTTCLDCGEKLVSQHYAQCSNPGVCATCGYQSSSLDAGHTWMTYGYKIEGNTHYWMCESCGEKIVNEHFALCTKPGVCVICGVEDASMPISNHIAYWGEPYETDGMKHWYTCVECNEIAFEEAHQESPVKPGYCFICGAEIVLEHDCEWGDVIVDTAATCTAEGEGHKVCAICGETETVVLPVIDHTMEEVTTPATCTEEGSVDKVCSVCGAKENVSVLPVIEHTMEEVITPATCTTEGSAVSTCSVCGTMISTVLPVVDHNMVVLESLSATCTADGYRVTACTMCGMQRETIYSAYGHTFNTIATSNENGTHYFYCVTCGTRKQKDCEYVEYTIGNVINKVCTVCAYTEVEVIPAEEPDVTETTEGTTPEPAEETVTIAAPVEIHVMENVVVNVANNEDNLNDEGEEIIPERAILSVSELVYEPTKVDEVEVPKTIQLPQSIMAPAAAPETTEEAQTATVSAVVEKVFVVSMTLDGVKIQPNKSSVSVSVKIEEEEFETLANNENLKLVMVLDDGSIVEVEYELVDGCLVITTDVFGVFMLVDCTQPEA